VKNLLFIGVDQLRWDVIGQKSGNGRQVACHFADGASA